MGRVNLTNKIDQRGTRKEIEMFKRLRDLVRDEGGTTTVEWIVVGTIAVLVVGLACKALADKASAEEGDLEIGWDALLP